MTMERFDAINKMHIFVPPNARAYAVDKLYQLRDFIDAYNENLQNVVILGKHLCVDESMNQWLGHEMLYLKKIPRKPHSIGQEYKTTADVKTCIIIRLDVSGDDQKKKFDNDFSRTIASLLRLVEPWLNSGRTVIADSWFGSSAMVRAVKSYGRYFIMQVKRKKYWPRGMPVNDMVLSSLDASYGSVHVMKTYRWEMRYFSFFLAVTEANAFSAHKYVEMEDSMNHFEFRWRLAQSLPNHSKVMSEGLNNREPYQLRHANTTTSAQKIVSLGKLPSGDYRCLR